MKYLVTGGCGFVGSNLSAEVLRRGEQLYVFDNLSRAGSTQNLAWLRGQGEFEFFHGDVRSRHDIDRAVELVKPDVVFHLAGQVAMTTSVEQPFKDFEINAMGTVSVLEAVRKHCPEAAILYSSTNKVYGDLEDLRYNELETRYECVDYPKGLPETLPLDFSTPYGCSKGAADQYVRDYHRMYGLKTVVFRHSSMYGGGQYPTFDQGWVGWFTMQALRTKEDPNHRFTVAGNGKQVRDLLHAEDVVRLYFSAAERIDTVAGGVYNVGGGVQNAFSIQELLDQLSAELHVDLVPEHLEARRRDQKVFVASNDMIEGAVSWVPRVKPEVGVKTLMGWLSTYRSV